MVKAKITKIDIDKDNYCFLIKLSSDTPTKPIAGHRFVDLLGKNQYVDDIDLLLDLYGIKYVPKNVYMELGQALEEPVLHYRFPDKYLMRFDYEDYKDHKSGAFDLDEEKDKFTI